MRRLQRSHVHDIFLLLAMVSSDSMSQTSIAVGLALMTVGIVLQIWSKAVLRRNRELSTQGPYALCRHPFYLGNAVFDLGICALSGTWILLLLYPIVFYPAYMPTIRSEEAKMRRLFGEAYDEFAARTPSLLPLRPLEFLRRRRAPLSWRVLLEEIQVSRTVRHLSFPFLVMMSGLMWRVPLVHWDNTTSLRILGVLVLTALVLAAVIRASFEQKPGWATATLDNSLPK
jgi:hypothetical protein